MTPRVPTEHYTAGYFRSGNYADRPLGRFSMYWFARRYFAALVCRHAPPGGPDRPLLEIGCGLGDLLSLLQSKFACPGVDLIEHAVVRARQHAPRARVVVGDGASWLATATTPLNVVAALHVMEHLPDPARTIRDAFVALVPGGLLLFATPHPDYALRRLKDHAHDAIGKDPTHINCHVPSVWKAWCEEAGFEVERQFGDGLWDVPYPLSLTHVIIATWNIRAGNALDHAVRLRQQFPADVLALQECQRPAPFDEGVHWAGSLARKGLAVVARDGLSTEPIAGDHSHDCLPVTVAGPLPFTFVATWSHRTAGRSYPQCVRQNLLAHLPLLRGGNTVVAGDFNSSPVFDRPALPAHTALVRWLRDELGLVSAWHAFTGEPHGEESRPTYYHRFKRDQPFHIDFVFIPEAWLPAITAVEIGTYDDWLTSDHRPVVVTLDGLSSRA